MLSTLPVKEGAGTKRKLDNVDFALKRIKLKVICSFILFVYFLLNLLLFCLLDHDDSK